MSVTVHLNKKIVVHVKTPTRRLIPISVLGPLAVAEGRALSAACAPVAVVGDLRRGVSLYRQARVDLVGVVQHEDLLLALFDTDREVMSNDGYVVRYWRALTDKTKAYLIGQGHDLGSIPDEVYFNLHLVPADSYGYAMVSLTGPEALVDSVNAGLGESGITVDNFYSARRNGEPVKLENEHQVFRYAGMPYLHPKSR